MCVFVFKGGVGRVVSALTVTPPSRKTTRRAASCVAFHHQQKHTKKERTHGRTQNLLHWLYPPPPPQRTPPGDRKTKKGRHGQTDGRTGGRTCTHFSRHISVTQWERMAWSSGHVLRSPYASISRYS